MVEGGWLVLNHGAWDATPAEYTAGSLRRQYLNQQSQRGQDNQFWPCLTATRGDVLT